jgi:hypothetical protein
LPRGTERGRGWYAVAAPTRPGGHPRVVQQRQDERPNSRRNSRKMFRTSRKIPGASGIASSVPGLAPDLASLRTGSLVAVPPCFLEAAGTALGDCWARAGDRGRGEV